MAGGNDGVDERLIAAHRALRAEGHVQFDMTKADGPEEMPAWLKAFLEWLQDLFAPVGRFIRWISSWMPEAPYARIFLWTVLIGLAVLLLWTIYDRVKHGVWRMPRLRRRKIADAVASDEEEWRPEAAPARALLEEADKLAADSSFDEAVHLLLLRSVEDIARRNPQFVRPALTSRDLARAETIPARPRQLFAEIAAVVEHSLFGGRDVDADQWARCRAAYADFAQVRNWAR